MISTTRTDKPALRDVRFESLFKSVKKAVMDRARASYYLKHASIRTADDDFAQVIVNGYEVDIWLDPDQPYRFIHVDCDCPGSYNQQTFCEHKVCALLAIQDYYRQPAAQKPSWVRILDRVIDDNSVTKKREPKNIIFYEIIRSYGDHGVELNVMPMEHLRGCDLDDRDSVAQCIVRRGIHREAKEVYSVSSLNRVYSRSAAEIGTARLLADRWRRHDISTALILPMIADSVVFYKGYGENVTRSVTISLNTASLGLDVSRDDGSARVKACAILDGEMLPLEKGDAYIVCEKPMWLVAGSKVFMVEGNAELVRAQLETGGVEIPEEDEPTLLEKYIPRLAESARISGNVLVSSRELDLEPVPRVYLSEMDGELAIELRFAYDGFEVPFEKDMPEISTKCDSKSRELVRIHRDQASEERSWKEMSSYGLKRATGGESFALRQNTDPVDFLIRYVPKMAEAGCEIYGEEEIKSVRVNRNRPRVSITVSSGIDWFDVKAVVNFGDLEVPLGDIRKAVKKREKYVKLCDGSIGEIPAEWIERYKHLFDLAADRDGGMRLSKSQIMLLDAAIADAQSVHTDEAFDNRIARLRDFKRIESKKLAAGFAGDFRQYQKSGYDWLHFLHDYDLGGCLADDMGLGKTIQTLVFLRCLRESGHARAADIVVMPKSLLVNWEREAAKFTPDAKVLIYAETDRTRDMDEFDNYDLILTTYGIMLRDIDILSKYTFHYAVLDESQAVKNPICQTSKAARLLKSDHRLVMTGTPVENSTSELWSQFAFINPGMLGSLDYFKREFVSPIEQRQDESAAQSLRRLVSPFILRRTKEQVAPELPPKTERIIYCDMSASQQRLYDKTRDYYRSQLLGMIEESGMQSARMKILEGLLRLRQISNHPALVEKTYKGESAKMEVLLDELETLRSAGHKALVFSQFTQMLKALRAELDTQKTPYLYLDGHTKDRQDRVDAFQENPDIPFFLISLKAGGVGLNLTAADYVIHIDPWWNPAVERQASDRTHRIGQDKPVFVNKLIARGTVEEKILELQERKKDLVDRLITSESGFFKSLTTDDVKELFG